MTSALSRATARRPIHSQGRRGTAHQAYTVCRGVALGALVLLSATALHAEPGAAGKLAPNTVPDAKVELTVIEDDAVRVEELRERGQTRQVTVQNKGSKAPAYEILMGDGSRDLSAGPGSTRGAAGQRVWRLLNF